jgi:hypothetical protein
MPFIVRAALTLALLVCIPTAHAQISLKELRGRIDIIISGAYNQATVQFPCKIGTTGKIEMAKWQSIDKCLNSAAERVDWQGITRQLELLHESLPAISIAELEAEVDSSLTAHSITFDKIFEIKNTKANIPLTNSLLKFLPPDSLYKMPVIDKSGKTIGNFVGIYAFERAGGLASANVYRLMLFQYVDLKGNVTSPGEKLLLDSYGIAWKYVSPQRGFRLPPGRIVIKR